MYNKHFLIILLLALCIFLIKIDSQGRHKTETKRTKFAKSQYADFFPPRNKNLFCFLQLATRHPQLLRRQSDSADTRPCTATGYLATNTSLLASVLTCPGLGLPMFCKYPCLFSFQRLLIYPKAKLFLLLNVVEH